MRTPAVRISLAISLVFSTQFLLVSAAIAQRPGEVCTKNGARAVFVGAPVQCRKVGKRLQWVNTQGSLRVTSGELPTARSGGPVTFTITAVGGTPGYRCALAPNNTMPSTLVLNNCSIDGTAPVLSDGTSKSVSPPFTIIVRDDAARPATVRVTLSLITELGPPVINVRAVQLTQRVRDSQVIATAAGGVPPYTFRLDNLGQLPMGMVIGSDGQQGLIQGTPSAAGVTNVRVCVVDSVGRSEDAVSCGASAVTVAAVIQVTVAKAGTGSGTVTSDVAGWDRQINCGDACTATYLVDANLRVTLTAQPDSRSQFAGWQGACQGQGTCTLARNADAVVTARFDPKPTVAGYWSGTLSLPNGGYTGCEAQVIGFSLSLTESAAGAIGGSTSNSRTITSGQRNGNAITVSLSTMHGPRGPYTWNWDGANTITGSMAYFCTENGTGRLLREGSETFSVRRS